MRARNVWYKALIGLAFLLLAAGVGMIGWMLHLYFDYQQYRKVLNYTMSGDTSVVQVVDETGEACTLTPTNRYAFYTFLTDSTGKRVQKADAGLTGRSFSFSVESYLGSAEGTVEETDSDCVRVTLSSDGKHWQYYFTNRAGFDFYQKALSPEGWTEPNQAF